SCLSGNTFRLGVQVGERGYDLNRADPNTPDNMSGFLEGGEAAMGLARDSVAKLKKEGSVIPPTAFEFAAPMIPQFDRFPVFYFTNHRAIVGPDNIHCTVETGCFLELNGAKKREDPLYEPQWLKPGDTVEMEVTGLGRLVNTVSLENAP